ncbi:hypothetical protein ACFRU3_38940 [Streptomyces sp. NPDC056910]|uniref:hypothetical protein n=1 Tax=Streptomyces sp. NPDC056910 TaxID=3345964 RepID=UPI0036C98DC0
MAQAGCTVLLAVPQLAYGDAAFVGEVDVGGVREAAGDVHQAVLLQLEGEELGVLVFQLEFLYEPGDIDVLPRVLLSVGVQPHQKPSKVGAALDRLTARDGASDGGAFERDGHTRGVLPRSPLQALVHALDQALGPFVEVSLIESAAGHSALLPQMPQMPQPGYGEVPTVPPAARAGEE